MGCCQSDLKGEKQADVSNEAPRPAQPVQTNFGTVNYDGTSTERRDTIYAPHEAVREKPAATPASDPASPAGADTTAAGSTQPQSASDNKISFENKIPNQPNHESTIQNKDNSENKPPYEDVTASPTSPNANNNIDEKLQTAAVPAEKSGEKSSQ